MGNKPSVEKGTLLAEVLENWKKIVSIKGLFKKRVVTLCKEDWPLVMQDRNPVKRWPPQGTFDLQELNFPQRHLEDCFLGQMDYWYV